MELSEADQTLNPGVFTVFLRLKHHCLADIAVSVHCASLTVTPDYLLAEDLDKTLEGPGERMSPKGDTDPEPCKQEVQSSLYVDIRISPWVRVV